MASDVFQAQNTRVGDGSSFHQGHIYQGNVTVNQAVDAEPVPSTVCDIPDFLSLHYVGRAQELARIEDALDEAGSDSPARCIIYGMPGQGKTQLALKYAGEVYAKKSVPYVFWMSAASPEKLVQGFSRLLDLVAYPNRQSLDQSARCVAARRWLEDQSAELQRRWLLILDNASSEIYDDLWKMLPRSNANGKILFTTRTKSVAETLATAFQKRHSCVELGALELSEAIKLFSSISAIGDAGSETAPPDDTEELVKLVGRLPLAIDQAASFVEVSQTPVSEVVEKLKSERLPDALEWENEVSRYSQKSVLATYTAAIDELQHDAPALIDLLRLAVFLDPEHISVALLKEGCAKGISIPTNPIITTVHNAPKKRERNIRNFWQLSVSSKRKADVKEQIDSKPPVEQNPEMKRLKESALLIRKIRTFLEGPMELHKALAYGQRLSLIQVLKHEKDVALRMHDLVHLILRRKLITNKEESQRWLLCTLDVITNTFRDCVMRSKEKSSWKKCEQILPHVRALQSHLQEYELKHTEFLDVCNGIAVYLGAQSRDVEASRICELTVAQARKTLGPWDPKIARRMRSLAILYLEQNRFDEAEMMAKEAFESSRKLLGPRNLYTVTCACTLSGVYMQQGRKDEAKHLFDEWAEILDQLSIQDNSTNSSAALRDLARAYRRSGRLETAVVLQKRALEARKRRFGTEHISTIHIMDDLANTYTDLDRLEEAEALVLQVVAAEKEIWGPEHLHTAQSMHKLTRTYARQSRWDEAVAMQEDVVRVYEATIGAEHPDTQQASCHLAHWTKKREGGSEVADMQDPAPSVPRVLSPVDDDWDENLRM